MNQIKELRGEIIKLQQEINALCYENSSESKQKVLSLTAIMKVKMSQVSELSDSLSTDCSADQSSQKTDPFKIDPPIN